MIDSRTSQFRHACGDGVRIGLRLVLGLTLCLAGFSKLQRPFEFLQNVYSYQLASPTIGLGVAIVLPWVELFCGLLILGNVCPSLAYVLAIMLSSMFVIVQLYAIRAGLSIACGCFGSSIADGETVGAGSLIRASLLLLAAVSGYGITAHVKASSNEQPAKTGLQETALTVACATKSGHLSHIEGSAVAN